MTAYREGTLHRQVAIIEGSAHRLARGMRWLIAGNLNVAVSSPEEPCDPFIRPTMM